MKHRVCTHLRHWEQQQIPGGALEVTWTSDCFGPVQVATLGHALDWLNRPTLPLFSRVGERGMTGAERMTETGKDALNIRRASAADAPAVLGLFDEVIEWFVSIGNVQQWGSEPWSTMPRRIAQVTEACALPGAWVAQNEQGDVRAFLALGESMPYVPAPTGPELYVRVLVASRDVRVRGIGRRLMAFADEQARAAGVDHLRVDCYAGGSGDLVRFYESCGYTRIAPFNVDGWPGMLLGRTL